MCEINQYIIFNQKNMIFERKTQKQFKRKRRHTHTHSSQNMLNLLCVHTMTESANVVHETIYFNLFEYVECYLIIVRVATQQFVAVPQRQLFAVSIHQKARICTGAIRLSRLV